MTDIEPAQPAALTSWDLLERQAHVLADSSIVPKQYRDKPGDIIAAAMMGAEVGWQPMTSLQLIHVVEGKPEISAEGMVALIRRAGHSITGELTYDSATVAGRRADNGDEMTYTFTMEDANRASLSGKANYKRYPKSMLWARAVSQLGRMLFPDVMLGVSYVHGEISGADLELGEPVVPPPVDVIDMSGRVIEATGPTVYASGEDVDGLLELIRQEFGEVDTAALREEIERRHRPRYSWSFAAHHQWTAIELRDCRAWVYARVGLEPFDDGSVVDVETGEKIATETIVDPEPEATTEPAEPLKVDQPATADPAPIITATDIKARAKRSKRSLGSMFNALNAYLAELDADSIATVEALEADQGAAQWVLDWLANES
jgi:hypothetical protein